AWLRAAEVEQSLRYGQAREMEFACQLDGRAQHEVKRAEDEQPRGHGLRRRRQKQERADHEVDCGQKVVEGVENLVAAVDFAVFFTGLRALELGLEHFRHGGLL